MSSGVLGVQPGRSSGIIDETDGLTALRESVAKIEARSAATAMAYRKAAQAVGNASFVTVKCDTAEYDPNGLFNLATGQYTCPADGIYLCTAQVEFIMLAAKAVYISGFLKNGGETKRGPRTESAGAGGETAANANALVVAKKGDTLVTYLFQTGGATNLAVESSQKNWFSVTRVV
jgi:hypothetical protein